MRFYLREIGQGPRSGRDLTREEARDAMSLVLSQEATRAQMGAFLLLQRYKGESAEELAGFADAVRGSAHLIRPSVGGALDIGSPYDGRKKSIVVSVASSIVAAAAGVPVVMHGEKGIGPKHGVPVGDVLEALGIETDGDADEVQSGIEERGLAYMRQSRFVPQVFALRSLREELGLRPAFSTIEKIYNLANSAYSVIGLTHLPYLEKMMLTAGEAGFKRVLIVQGIEGNEDAPTSRPCRAVLWQRDEGGASQGLEKCHGGGWRRELRIDAAGYGLRAATAEEMAGGNAAHNARIAEAVFDGDRSGHRDLILLNAGIRIWLTERAESIEDGIAVAGSAIDSGAASAKLKALRKRP